MKEKIKSMAHSVKELVQDYLDEIDRDSFWKGFYWGWLLYSIFDLVCTLIVAAFKKRRGA